MADSMDIDGQAAAGIFFFHFPAPSFLSHRFPHQKPIYTYQKYYLCNIGSFHGVRRALEGPERESFAFTFFAPRSSFSRFFISFPSASSFPLLFNMIMILCRICFFLRSQGFGCRSLLSSSSSTFPSVPSFFSFALEKRRECFCFESGKYK